MLFPDRGAISLMINMANGQTVETAAIGREGAVGLLSGARAVTFGHHRRRSCGGHRLADPCIAIYAAFNRSPAIRHAVQIHIRAMLMQFQLGVACNALHPSKPAWHAGCSIFATTSTTMSSRSPRRRYRKYSVCDERR